MHRATSWVTIVAMSPIIDRYAAFDHCRAVLPWFQFASSRDPLPRLRKLALEMEAEGTFGRPPNFIIAACCHLLVSLRQIGIALGRYGKETRESWRVNYFTQFFDLLYLAWRLNHAPHDYYLQKMWLRPNRADWSQFLQQREHVILVKYLARTLPIERFDDKLNLFRTMRAASVPTIEVLLAASGGSWIENFTPDRVLPVRQDLVIKPTDGILYDGVEIWRYEAATDTYVLPVFEKVNELERWVSDRKCDWSGLLDRVLSLSTKRTYIVQGCARNQHGLELISPHAIANFRIVTAHCRGEFKVISATLRMGYDNQKFISGTYQANIDPETGVLGFATGRHAQWGFGEIHLETGQRLRGGQIGSWPQLKAVALRGHEQYPWMPTIGWDVIDSDKGPMLMEANAFWGVDIAQIDTPFLGQVGYAGACIEAYERERCREFEGAGPRSQENVTCE